MILPAEVNTVIEATLSDVDDYEGGEALTNSFDEALQTARATLESDAAASVYILIRVVK